MPKKPGTILREYAEQYFAQLKEVSAEVEIFDGDLPQNKLSSIQYMVTITWYDGTLIIGAEKDNKLTVTATETTEKGRFFNAFTVTGYHVMKDTIKAVWDCFYGAIYAGNTSIESIYYSIEREAKLAVQP